MKIMNFRFDEEIEYEGNTYPVRYADVVDDGVAKHVKIGHIGLEADLMDDEYEDYISEQARYVDEQFFGYVDDNALCLEQTEFNKYVEEEFCI